MQMTETVPFAGSHSRKENALSAYPANTSSVVNASKPGSQRTILALSAEDLFSMKKPKRNSMKWSIEL